MAVSSVNYYDLLQINPRAEIETIERVYRIMAARYHPDNQQTGDAGTVPGAHRRLPDACAIR